MNIVPDRIGDDITYQESTRKRVVNKRKTVGNSKFSVLSDSQNETKRKETFTDHGILFGVGYALNGLDVEYRHYKVE